MIFHYPLAPYLKIDEAGKVYLQLKVDMYPDQKDLIDIFLWTVASPLHDVKAWGQILNINNNKQNLNSFAFALSINPFENGLIVNIYVFMNIFKIGVKYHSGITNGLILLNSINIIITSNLGKQKDLIVAFTRT